MYNVFIRPLEYAAVVWDGCSQSKVEKLETVQLCAVRIVTTFKTSFVSRDRLATTFRWEENKLTTMHKIQDLSEIIPNTRGNDLHTEPEIMKIILYQNVD